VVKRSCVLGLLLLLVVPATGWGWGEEGHRIVIESAAQALLGPPTSAIPVEPETFYRAQLPFLLEHVTDPDDWSVIDPDEARRHYLDLELLGEDALSSLPATYEEARARYGEETLKQAGTLPWTILEFVRGLTEAERQGDWERSALLAAALSHYVGDACMPLHTTVNYKGQETGNLILDDRTDHRHVHLRFEVAMLRAFETEVRAKVFARTSRAREVTDPLALVQELLRESHSRIDPILQADKELTAKWQGRFTPEFYGDLYQRTGELATEQLARAAEATASLWLYAWQAAGRPSMPEKRVAFGEGVALVERMPITEPREAKGASPEVLEHRQTKVFRYQGVGYAIVTADWRAAGRFQASRKLREEEYQGLWQALEGAGVWEVAEAKPEAGKPAVTLAIARSGRERRLTLVPQPAGAGGRPTDERPGRIIEAIRAIAPETPGPGRSASPGLPAPGSSAPSAATGAETKGAPAVP